MKRIFPMAGLAIVLAACSSIPPKVEMTPEDLSAISEQDKRALAVLELKALDERDRLRKTEEELRAAKEARKQIEVQKEQLEKEKKDSTPEYLTLEKKVQLAKALVELKEAEKEYHEAVIARQIAEIEFQRFCFIHHIKPDISANTAADSKLSEKERERFEVYKKYFEARRDDELSAKKDFEEKKAEYEKLSKQPKQGEV